MNSICYISRLSFFKAEKHKYMHKNSFDASNCPRPHFCMGLVLDGFGSFKDCTTGKIISVKKGDIIFVPITSRYISKWQGTPKISYISIHFIFNSPGIFTQQKKYILQKIGVNDFEKTKSAFEFILDNFDKEEQSQLSILSKFYDILSEIYPYLQSDQTTVADSRINKAIKYIEQNYSHEISTDTLAKISNMSISRFYARFKEATSMTAVEYINSYRINRAILLLMYGDDTSIEHISEAVGFSSSTYFRRVFKNITGKSPREYKKTCMEI